MIFGTPAFLTRASQDRLKFRGSIGVPYCVVNTKFDPFHASATRNRSAFLRSARNFSAVITIAGRGNPEEGPLVGVITRMDSIGQHIDRVVEKVTARAAKADEVTALHLPQRRSYVLVIDRTHFVGDTPVETCDIVFPGERYELTYTIAVAD